VVVASIKLFALEKLLYDILPYLRIYYLKGSEGELESAQYC
jgi:hypothetical protein